MQSNKTHYFINCILILLIFTCKNTNQIEDIDYSYDNIGNYKAIAVTHVDTTVTFSDSVFLMVISVDTNEVKIFNGMSNNIRGCYSVRKIEYDNPKIDTLFFGPSGSWYRSGRIIFKGDNISLEANDSSGIVKYDFRRYNGSLPPASWPDSICNE